MEGVTGLPPLRGGIKAGVGAIPESALLMIRIAPAPCISKGGGDVR